MPTAFILFSVTTAGYFDLRWHRIPNWLVALTLLLSLGWHMGVSGLAGLWGSLAGLLLGTALLFPLFLLRGMGAGDVKYFGALGAAVTYQHLFSILAISLVVGAAMALGVILVRGQLKETLRNLADLLGRFLRGRIGPHPVVGIDNGRALVVHFTVAVAVATWIFVIFYRFHQGA
jgi:prepilin peptidase CpaA